MDPQTLRNFERRPAFGIYPKGEKDPLPSHIRKIRDKWAKHGVNLGPIWTVLRNGYNLLEEKEVIDPDTPYQLTHRDAARKSYNRKFLSKLSPHMRALVKRIRNDKRTQEQKESDRKILVAHCGKWTDESGPVDAFESFCEKILRRDPLLPRVPIPDPRRRKRGRTTEVVGPAVCLIALIVKGAGLVPKKGPKADRFYWSEIRKLLSFYYPWETHLTSNDLRSFYNHHRRSGIPSDWPKPQTLLAEPRKHSLP